ncbi:MAG TPA: hypothetical protein VHM19_19400 [Polyangiales bacterium]|nr:hypothetical protein [Polyangiales bacterium]
MAQLAPHKLSLLFAPDLTGIRWNEDLPKAKVRELRRFAPLLVVYHWLLYGVSLVGLAWLAVFVVRAQSPRSRWEIAMSQPVLLSVGLTVVFAAIHAIFFGGPRFHFPLLPWLALLATVPLHHRFEEPAPTNP